MATPWRRAAPDVPDVPEGEAMAKEILVSFGVDIDAVAGWLGS
jgi:hypothetical protein